MRPQSSRQQGRREGLAGWAGTSGTEGCGAGGGGAWGGDPGRGGGGGGGALEARLQGSAPWGRCPHGAAGEEGEPMRLPRVCQQPEPQGARAPSLRTTTRTSQRRTWAPWLKGGTGRRRGGGLLPEPGPPRCSECARTGGGGRSASQGSLPLRVLFQGTTSSW